MSVTSSRTTSTSRWFGIALMLAVLSCLALFLSGCSKDGDDVVEPVPGGGGGYSLRTTVVGLVRNSDGAPLAGAIITSGGQTTTSDDAGAFMLVDIGSDSRCFVRAARPGYFGGSAGVIAQANGITRVRITLLPSTTVATFNGSGGTDADLPNGARVQIPTDAVVDANGSAIDGAVSLAMVHLDPEDDDFAAMMPGGDLVATGTDGDRQLLSFGILMVRMSDGGGNELQLAPGTTAEITMPVPPSLQGEAPSSIPLWHYNETTGKWEEDGTATLQGDRYVGSVGHFSSWNCDLPFDRATISGRVFDCNGDPVEGLTVDIGQTYAVTDANGRYERFVPTGIDMSVGVNAPDLGLNSSTLSAGPFTDGQSTTMPDLTVQCPAYVSLTINCSTGAALMGYTSITWSGGSAMVPFSAAGTYRIAVPSNGGSADLQVMSTNGAAQNATVQLPNATGQTVDAGVFELCPTGGGGGGTYNSGFTINGDGLNNMAVAISTNGLFSYGSYEVDSDGTVGFAVNNNGQSLSIGFPGNNTGSWSSVEGDGEALLGIGINGQSYVGWDFTLTVTEFGPVGGHIRGLFSGTVVRFDPVTFEMHFATVTSGTFDLLRNPDE